jgi:drug/metabolite transporter (DMT)-like permease
MSSARFSRIDLLLLLIVSVWGVNFSVVKSAISGPAAPFTPTVFNALRFSVAAVILLGLLRRSGGERPASRRDWLAIFGLGLVGNTLYQFLFIVGLNYTSPASSALIVATTPVIVALIGATLRLERLSALAWLGIGLSFVGIALVVFGTASGASTPQAASPLLGNLLVLGSTTTWSVYTILAAPLLRRYSATTVTSLSLSAGTLPLILIALPDLARLDWRAVPVAGWSAALFSGAFALATAYSVWNRGVKEIGGARTAVYSNLIPLVAAIVAWIARGDALTIFHLFGAAIVLTGINLTRLGRQARVEALPAEE